jgi:hypothetical protein
MTREGSKTWHKKMMKLVARERKDRKRDFGFVPFLPASSYCFPLLLLLLARTRQRREREGSPLATTEKREKTQSAEQREEREERERNASRLT